MTGRGQGEFRWRGAFADAHWEALHAAAFGPGQPGHGGRHVRAALERHSLGWVTAQLDGDLVGFVNVPWDGLVHAWVQDVMVAPGSRRRGIGRRLVAEAADGARAAGCQWLHVDFQPALRPFYLEACGFATTGAGLLRL